MNYKQDIASRLLKLLMISRVNKIPIFVLERLKWELGLPLNYEKALIPEFPDYFRVIGGDDFGANEKVLELVCWSDECAVSEVEKKGGKSGKIEFLLQFSKEFEMDKKYKKWLDEWKKLPYVSPFQNAMHLGTKSDESDKWVVAVLHEVLNLFVGKKAEKENLLCLGEYLGLRPSFKRALLQHPGIFYVSSKIGTHTVVLREAYKRGMLIERHTLLGMRSKYIQLMNVVKDDNKAKNAQQKSGVDAKKSEGVEVEGDGDEMYDESDADESEIENASKRVRQERRNTRDVGKTGERGAKDIAPGGEMRDSSDDDESDDCGEAVEVGNVTRRGRRHERKGRDFERSDTRSVGRGRNRRGTKDNVLRGSTRSSRGTNVRGGEMDDSSDDDDDESEGYGEAIDVRNETKRGRHTMKAGDFERRSSRGAGRRTNGRGSEENVSKSTPWSSRRTNGRGGNEDTVSKFSTRSSRRTNFRGDDSNTTRRFTKKSNFSGNRGRSDTGRRST